MTQLHAVVTVEAGGYQVGWSDGLKVVQLDDTFETPRAAIDRANLIDPSPTTRSAPETPASGLGATALVTPGSSESPDATCAGCGEPFPPGRRGQRRTTCSAACRVAVSRRSGENGPGRVRRGADRSVTPSRAV